MLSNFKEEQLKMVCISDNMKYFVFEGPNFDGIVSAEKKEKDKKLSPNAASKGKTKEQKK